MLQLLICSLLMNLLRNFILLLLLKHHLHALHILHHLRRNLVIHLWHSHLHLNRKWLCWWHTVLLLLLLLTSLFLSQILLAMCITAFVSILAISRSFKMSAEHRLVVLGTLAALVLIVISILVLMIIISTKVLFSDVIILILASPSIRMTTSVRWTTAIVVIHLLDMILHFICFKRVTHLLLSKWITWLSQFFITMSKNAVYA